MESTGPGTRTLWQQGVCARVAVARVAWRAAGIEEFIEELGLELAIG